MEKSNDTVLTESANTYKGIVETSTVNGSQLTPFCPTVWGEEFLLLKITDGNGFLYVDGDKLTVDQGDMAVIRPFALHTAIPAKNSPLSFETVSINFRAIKNDCEQAREVKKYRQFLNDNNVPALIKISDETYADIEKLFVRLSNYHSEQEELECIAQLLYLLHLNRLNSCRNTAQAKRRFAAITAIEYLRTNYKKNITVETLALKCGYSEFYLMKLFKQYTGLSCIEYLNRFRADLATRLLTTTDMGVGEIAFKVGFNNVSYFNRQFKQLYKTTPEEYRASNFDNNAKK